MAEPDGDRPSDTMRERASESTRKLWLLLDADRWIVTVLLSAIIFVAILGGGTLFPGAFRAPYPQDPAETLYQALITSTITGVTLVLTLSQLVLSQELGAVGDQRERMEGAQTFRSDVADAIGSNVTPVEPSAFLRALVGSTKERAQSFEESVDATDTSDEFQELVSEYVDSVVTNADEVASQLEGANFGEFDVVRAALDYNYSWKIYAGHRIADGYEHELSDEAREDLSDLVRVLELFGPAREHFKTLYFQWELSNLSRTLLYVAVPALSVAVVSLLFLTPLSVVGSTLGVTNALLVLAVTTTVSLLPFTILLAYILRIVTVTKRTLSIGPFILRETDRSTDINWEQNRTDEGDAADGDDAGDAADADG